MGLRYGGVFSDKEVAVAKKLVNNFIDRGCFKGGDFEDLMQEVLSDWLLKRERFDASEGVALTTYMWRVVSNKLRDLLDKKKSAKRKIESVTDSLDAPVSEEDKTPLIDKIADKLATDLTDVSHRVRMQWALEQAMGKLTNQQRQICQFIKDDLSIKEIALRLNIHRSTVSEEKKRIKAVFEAEGLRIFLK